jgi:inner membrane transporter RhtA
MIRAISLLLIAMSSIQGGATVAKRIFPVLGPAGTSALRLLFATIILWVVFRPWKKSVTREQLKKLSFYGICLGFMNLSFYYALERIPLGLAVSLEFTGPLAVAIFTSGKKTDYIWAILAGIGIFLIVPDLRSSTADPFGVFLAILAGCFWAGYILYGKKAGKDIDGTLAATWGMTFAAAVVIPAGVFTSAEKLFSPEVLPFGIGVAILSSALPYTLEMLSLKKIPTKTFGVLMSLEPAVAAIAGLLFLNEQLTLVQWFAMLLIMLSSLGSSLSAEKNLTTA